MPPNIVLVLTIGVLFAAGVTLLLERSLTRVVLGVILLGNGANLLILLGGRPGGAPIAEVTAAEEMSDPLPQALILTAIVITLGLTAFLLAMAYRSWLLFGHDEVQDDLEDRLIVQRALADQGPNADDDAEDSDDRDTDPIDAIGAPRTAPARAGDLDRSDP
ncbi:multisubunit sodium/proton antiporter MrpC subunit [Micromonospora sp. Llam0]|uniref:Na(+)/H(+) antiporter subunit C n=1 Tax=Micromonospora sp. Llam0 TaxID=2485143 RepID=UPI000F494218|nr:Na(+)/H(+) antiporter subunit C [Micromonospora sp. Llam0]ROO58865.1 multisubunit sodium/proton antiporter MrpC subunit [Micromonospora sp. Llam0]